MLYFDTEFGELIEDVDLAQKTPPPEEEPVKDPLNEDEDEEYEDDDDEDEDDTSFVEKEKLVVPEPESD